MGNLPCISKGKTTLTKYDPYADESQQAPDKYEYYETLFDPNRAESRVRAGPKPASKPAVKKSQEAVVSELADSIVLEGGFRTTYKPGRHEAEWLLSSLRSFYDRAVRKEEDLRKLAQYTINNPVRAGLVGSPKDYPYSWHIWKNP